MTSSPAETVAEATGPDLVVGTPAAPHRRPVLLAVDDDPQVLRAVARDLRGQFGKTYRVLSAGGGQEALDLLRELDARGDEPALLLADQRMPGMTGVGFLREARVIFPSARRVLLTAYADTDAAIAAINEARLDHYLLKPWDPPEESLFPVVHDLLADWASEHKPGFIGVRVVGPRYGRASHELRDFLTRQLVPFRFLDVEELDGAALHEANPDVTLPMVLLPDRAPLAGPSTEELAAALGLATRATGEHYDLVIVGAGPAGLAAAVYGGSEGLSTLLVDRDAPGGQAGTSSRIENYLGFPQGVSGAELARRARDQATKFNVEMLTPQEVVRLEVAGPAKVVHMRDGRSVTCSVLLLAMGVAYNRLDVPEAERFEGLGLYYGAALTEADTCAGVDVFIVGGANSAGQAAMFFSTKARSVTLVVRGDSLGKGMSAYLVDEVAAVPNINVRLRSRIVGLEGREQLECVRIRDDVTGEEETLHAGGVFTFIGARPATEWLDGVVVRDTEGFVCAGPDLPRDAETGQVAGWDLDRDPYLLETNVPGVFVAGDVRHRSIKRVTTGVGDGAMAVQFMHRYLGTA
jgi:thioredoxin reductase (NADPH)